MCEILFLKIRKFCELVGVLGFFFLFVLFFVCHDMVHCMTISYVVGRGQRETGTYVLLLPAESYSCLILTLLWN